MLGSGPEDADIIEMSAGKRWLPGLIGGRSRLVLVIAGVCALLAVGGTLVGLRLDASGPADPALAKLITETTTVPVNETVPAPTTPNTSVAVPVGGLPGQLASSGLSPSDSILVTTAAPFPVSGTRLTSDGKPEVLYVGNGYCPYCAAENWALIVALSRFGTFSGLSTSRSPLFENVPPIDSWTFYRSSYASPYLAFVPVETASNVLVSPKSNPSVAASYRKLQRLTPTEQAVFTMFDQPKLTPFLDFGGQAEQLGSQVQASALAHLTWSEIAADLRRPQTPAGMTILTAVDSLTAELCQLTADRPAAVCRS